MGGGGWGHGEKERARERRRRGMAGESGRSGGVVGERECVKRYREKRDCRGPMLTQP